jgi:hypothetical protein
VTRAIPEIRSPQTAPLASSVQPAQEGRQDKTSSDSNQHIILLLPAHQRITHQIRHIIPGWFDLAAEHDPSDVGIPEAFGDIIGITVMIDELMMAAVI